MATASFKSLRETADLRHLRQIIVGLDEGVILIDPDQSLLWANDAALAMHGVEDIAALGANVDEYRARFQLRYRNNHRLEADDYPIDRVVAGDAFSEVVVEVIVAGEDEPRWVHQVRSLVLNDADDDEPACLVLIIQDVSARYEAEDRFEQSFNANPAPAVICRLNDLRFVKVNQGFLDMTGFQRDHGAHIAGLAQLVTCTHSAGKLLQRSPNVSSSPRKRGSRPLRYRPVPRKSLIDL